MRLILVSMFFISSFSFAKISEELKPQVFLSYCTHFGSGVSYSFQSCINSNFQTIQRELGGFFSYCMNIGDDVSYSFVSCVNSGFRETQNKLENNVWLQDCYNFDRTNLDYSFVSCVNSNFNRISLEISNRKTEKASF